MYQSRIFVAMVLMLVSLVSLSSSQVVVAPHVVVVPAGLQRAVDGQHSTLQMTDLIYRFLP